MPKASARTVACSAAIAFYLLLSAPFNAYGQNETLRFDVTSVKRHNPQLWSPEPTFEPGSWRFKSYGLSLRVLAAFAYGFSNQATRVIGGPALVGSGAYDIEATVDKSAIPANTPGPVIKAQMKRRLQALLADRFQLAAHVEKRNMPVYVITVAPGGPKLEKSSVDEKDCPGPEVEVSASTTCHGIAGGRGPGVRGFAITLDDLTLYLENWIDRPLINETGIQGLFKIQTTGWRALNPGDQAGNNSIAALGAAAEDLPSFYDVFAALGLKLQVQKRDADVLVIDNAGPPTEN